MNWDYVYAALCAVLPLGILGALIYLNLNLTLKVLAVALVLTIPYAALWGTFFFLGGRDSEAASAAASFAWAFLLIFALGTVMHRP